MPIYGLEMLTDEQASELCDQTFIQAIESFDELPSTNDYAIERSSDAEAIRPLLILARRQTAGRGRGANTWWSSEGALTFSILFSGKQVSASHLPASMISLAIGVAVCDTMEAIDPAFTVGLKWPNDVFIHGRKIAGILIECPSSVVGDVVVGIGINVNNSTREAPSEISARATSLTDLLGHPSDPFDVLKRVLMSIEHQLTQLHADPLRVTQRCASLCVLSGRQVELSIGQRRIAGKCVGIAASGSLLIETERETIECLAGHVEAINPG